MSPELLARLKRFSEELGDRKPIIPEVIEFFVAYADKHIEWGSLHVLSDGNYGSVDFCLKWAIQDGDEFGAELCRVLQNMSKTQCSKILRMAWNLAHVIVRHPAAAPSSWAAYLDQPGEESS